MKSETYLPCDALKPYVRMFMIHETKEEQLYKVIPGTSLVMGFQYKGKLSYLEDGQETPLAVSGVTGLMDQYRVFKNSADIGTVLVFFNEAGAAHFFPQPVHELFRESLSLENFMLRSELLLFEEQLCEAKNDLKRIKVVENFLLSRLNSQEPDKLVIAALALIHQSKGIIRMTDLAEQLHISQSPLEKRFRKAVGASPKKYASIVRLKSVINDFSSIQSVTQLGYESGFYDQAHFIKEFKRFTGLTPENYFNPKA